MNATLDEVRTLILEEFPDSDVTEIGEVNSYRIGGIIHSREFVDKSVRERQQIISDKVRKRLGFRGINIGILFPLAPGESLQ